MKSLKSCAAQVELERGDGVVRPPERRIRNAEVEQRDRYRVQPVGSVERRSRLLEPAGLHRGETARELVLRALRVHPARRTCDCRRQGDGQQGTRA